MNRDQNSKLLLLFGAFVSLAFLGGISAVVVVLSIVLIFFFHGAILYPEALIGIINPEDAYIDMSAQILRLISVSIILYGIISVYYQTILGSGNTIYSLIIEITTILLYLSACYLFIQVLNFEIFWIWTVEYIYFGVIGIMSFLYLKNSNWKLKSI